MDFYGFLNGLFFRWNPCFRQDLKIMLSQFYYCILQKPEPIVKSSGKLELLELPELQIQSSAKKPSYYKQKVIRNLWTFSYGSLTYGLNVMHGCCHNMCAPSHGTSLLTFLRNKIKDKLFINLSYLWHKKTTNCLSPWREAFFLDFCDGGFSVAPRALSNILSRPTIDPCIL